ncbi:MAG: hypothetical protein DA408_04485 [Bacteroidetes bacterium]|nr:MAG: hypothetical protein C7N36_13850 [Bacteroidota bacterium]PTM13999.1 MAG: hypothetical protein DA408_04485 [Bacteroidota bacterium]
MDSPLDSLHAAHISFAPTELCKLFSQFIQGLTTLAISYRSYGTTAKTARPKEIMPNQWELDRFNPIWQGLFLLDNATCVIAVVLQETACAASSACRVFSAGRGRAARSEVAHAEDVAGPCKGVKGERCKGGCKGVKGERCKSERCESVKVG